MLQKEFVLFNRLRKTRREKEKGENVNSKAKGVIKKIFKTKYYKENPYFSNQLIIKYNFLSLLDKLEAKKSTAK